MREVQAPRISSWRRFRSRGRAAVLSVLSTGLDLRVWLCQCRCGAGSAVWERWGGRRGSAPSGDALQPLSLLSYCPLFTDGLGSRWLVLCGHYYRVGPFSRSEHLSYLPSAKKATQLCKKPLKIAPVLPGSGHVWGSLGAGR